MDDLEQVLRHGDSDTPDWRSAVLRVTGEPERAYGWAVERLDDPRTNVRRFAADVLYTLSLDDYGPSPGTEEAIRPRLTAEEDRDTLSSLLGAYRGPLEHVAAHARHPDSGIRARVAHELAGTGSPFLDLVAEMTDDPDGDVRASALSSLFVSEYFYDWDFRPDSVAAPFVLAAYTAHRDDPHLQARVEALCGLARYGDVEALAVLRAVRPDRAEMVGRWRQWRTRPHEQRQAPTTEIGPPQA
ncbi:hypothetical protein ACQPZJ_45125 [Actinoplanes sp. CA-054009]